MEYNLYELNKKINYQIFQIKGITNENTDIHLNNHKFLPFIGFILKIRKKTYPIGLFYSEKAMILSEIVDLENAIGGINGGFWDKKKKPLDYFVYNNRTITEFCSDARPLLIFKKNEVIIEKCNEEQHNIETNNNILQTGPLLVYEGKINLDYSDYKENASQFDSDITKDRHPRSIFGYNKEFYYFIVIDGRSKISAGLYLEECAQLVKDLNLDYAVNLDGGASSTLIMNKERLNHPRFSFIGTSRYLSAPVPGKERKIPNAILIYDIY